jgi:hypothetical protein
MKMVEPTASKERYERRDPSCQSNEARKLAKEYIELK